MKYLLSQLVWDTQDWPMWRAPHQADRMIDLRPLTAQAKAGTVQGRVLIATERDPLPGEVLLVGRFRDSLGNNARDAVKDLLGLPEAITVQNIPDLIDLILGPLADPELGILPPPLMPDSGGRIRFNLGEARREYKCPTSGTQFDNILKMVHAEYRQVRQQGGDLHRKLPSVYKNKFRVENHELFIPRDLPRETPVKPSTTLQDTFNVGDHSNLDGQASSDGWLWEAVEGSGNALFKTDTQVYAEGVVAFSASCLYRAESDLSSVDHYVEAGVMSTSDNLQGIGLIARKDSSATLTCYECDMVTTSDVLRILKRVGGTHTSLQDNAAGTLNTSTFYTVRFNVDGSTLQTLLAGVQQGSDLTDTSITTGTRIGMTARAPGATTRTGGIEDFGGEDIIPSAGDGTIREEFSLSDRLSYAIFNGMAYTLREEVGMTDRLTYALTGTFAYTMRERIGLSERLNGAAVSTIARTMREVFGMRERAGNDDVTSGSGVAQGETFEPFDTASGAAGMLVLTHLYLDEGQENYSSHQITGTHHDHTGTVMQFGTIEKEVEIPCGAPRLADMSTVFSDHDQYWRRKFGNKTPRMRQQDFWLGPRGGQEHLFHRTAKMTVTNATFPPLQMRIEGSDQTAKWMARQLPSVINRANFPNLPSNVTEAFFPIVNGNVSSIGHGGQGAIRCIHVDTVQHRYTGNFGLISPDHINVYTKAPDEELFAITSSSYTLVEEDLIVNGVTFIVTYIQFSAALTEGTEVRADIGGLTDRGAWGTLPAVSALSQNAVDHIIDLLEYAKVVESEDVDFADYDLASFQTVYDKFTALAYESDYTIAEPLTWQEVFTQLRTPFLIHMVPNNFDQIKLVLITDDDFTDAPVIDDYNSTLLRSEVISLATPTVNRYRYRRGRNPASDQWGAEETYDNLADQEELGEIEQVEIDLHSVRGEQVALEVVAERSAWEDLQSHRIEFDVDTVSHLDKIELLKPFKFTHYGGLVEGGWVEEFFVPYYVGIDLTAFRTKVRAIRRQVVSVPRPSIATVGDWKLNARAGPEYLLSAQRLYQWFADTRYSYQKMVVLGSNAAGTAQVPVDDDVFPLLANQIRGYDGLFYGNKLYIVHQEEVTGRVGFTRFNAATQVYEVINQTVVASTSDADIGVTIAVQDPSGKPTIIFQGDREYSAGSAFGAAGDYKRAYITVRADDGTWSTPVMMGNPSTAYAFFWFVIWGDPAYNGAVHTNVGRAIRGENNRIHHVFSQTEPGDIAATPDFQIQTLRTDGTLSTTYEWELTTGSGTSPTFLVGDPASFEDANGQFWIAAPIGKLAEAKIALWKDKDNPTVPDNQVLISTADLTPDIFGVGHTASPAFGVRYLSSDGKLHVVHSTRAGGSDDWAAYKTISPPFETAVADPSYTTGSRQDQIGPVWPTNVYARHGFDIKMVGGVPWIFKATSGSTGIPNVDDAPWILEKINVNTDIPEDPTYTLQDFIDEHS